jgi:hypothetical protein
MTVARACLLSRIGINIRLHLKAQGRRRAHEHDNRKDDASDRQENQTRCSPQGTAINKVSKPMRQRRHAWQDGGLRHRLQTRP